MAIGFYESIIFDFEEGRTARVNTSVSSGKWYWEITVTRGVSWDSSIVSVGVGTIAVLPQQIFTDTLYGWGIDSRGIARHAGFGSTQVLPAYRHSNSYGEVTIGIALDMDNGYLWGIVADEWGRYDQVGNPEVGTDPHISGITGTIYPMVSLQLFSELERENVRITANFGKLPFKHNVPSGYETLVGPSSSSSSSVSFSSRSSSSTNSTFIEDGIYYPEAITDDGYWHDASIGFYRDSNYLIIGDHGGSKASSYILFNNIPIPPGSTIISSFIRFTSYNNALNDNCDARIYFNNTSFPICPTNKTEAEALIKTSVYSSWSSLAHWTDGSKYDSPSLNEPIQEVIGRGDWASGRDLMAIITSLGIAACDYDAKRFASGYEYNGATERAELHLTWEEPSVSVSSSSSSISLPSGSSSSSSYSQMPASPRVAQLIAQIEAIESGNVRVSQLLAQVEATEPDEVKVAQVLTQVEVTEPDEVKVAQVLVQVEVI